MSDRNSRGMDASVALIRHITTLIVLLSITLQSIVPCRCDLCCHDLAHEVSDCAVSASECNHSPETPGPCPHDSSDETRDPSSSHPESQPVVCHRFSGFTTPDSSTTESVFAVAVLTSPAKYVLEIVVTANAGDWFRQCDLSRRSIDPGAVLRLQI